MSLSGQFGPHDFKREHRRREMKPTEGPTPHLIYCCCVPQQEPLQSENWLHYHIFSFMLPWHSRDTHSSCGGWEYTGWHSCQHVCVVKNSSTVHCAAQPVNATLIFHRIHRRETSCFCYTDFSKPNLSTGYKTIENMRSVYKTLSCNKLYAMQTKQKTRWGEKKTIKSQITSCQVSKRNLLCFLNVVSFTRGPHNFCRNKEA